MSQTELHICSRQAFLADHRRFELYLYIWRFGSLEIASTMDVILISQQDDRKFHLLHLPKRDILVFAFPKGACIYFGT